MQTYFVKGISYIKARNSIQILPIYSSALHVHIVIKNILSNLSWNVHLYEEGQKGCWLILLHHVCLQQMSRCDDQRCHIHTFIGIYYYCSRLVSQPTLGLLWLKWQPRGSSGTRGHASAARRGLKSHWAARGRQRLDRQRGCTQALQPRKNDEW